MPTSGRSACGLCTLYGVADTSADPDRLSGTPRQLSEEAILAAAQELTRRVGVERLTMRALADALGVSPMATYHYVEGRDQVIRLMVERLMADVDVPPAREDVEWDQRLWDYMQAMREALADYPGIADFLLTRELTAAARRYMENCIVILEDGGFSSDEARSAFTVIYTFMWGGSIFLGVQTRRKAAGKRKQRTGKVPTVDELASVEAAENGYRTIVAGLRHLRAQPSPIAQPSRRSERSTRTPARQ